MTLAEELHEDYAGASFTKVSNHLRQVWNGPVQILQTGGFQTADYRTDRLRVYITGDEIVQIKQG